MLPHHTRASQRALAAASVHAATRRPLRVVGASVGALCGILLSVGLATPAVAAEADAAASVPTAETFAHITAESAIALNDAKTAVAAADDLNAEVAASGLTLDAQTTTVDTADLEEDIADLSDLELVPVMLISDLSTEATKETQDVIAETAAVQTALTAAQEQKAAEDAAKAAAEKAAAEALAAANTVEGAKATAAAMASSQYGWGSDQFSCLNSLWTKESGWNYQAYNASSGATGIPQALPGSKMASAGSDWQTNAATQIAWGLSYISGSYGSPCSAWAHSQATNWY